MSGRRDDDLPAVRRAYAKQILAAAHVTDESVERAFAAVPREDYLGPGPWPIYGFHGTRYESSRSDDPILLYTDDLVGIAPERGINNGQPSLHAHLLACAAAREGEHIVHVGAGVGYYSAIMAEIVGPSGRVTAIEFEPDLAARATVNLARYRNVTVVEADGTAVAFDPADVVYVNAGATRPVDAWLDRLTEGGRLVLPLTVEDKAGDIERRGAVFVITRRGADFLARWVSPVAIYPCVGARDAVSERALAKGFGKGGWRKVTRLYRRDDVPPGRCWVRAPGWCLAYE
ncbi:MAG: methyltransferase domain-containing protein [Acetobacteraceae bacterium]